LATAYEFSVHALYAGGLFSSATGALRYTRRVQGKLRPGFFGDRGNLLLPSGMKVKIPECRLWPQADIFASNRRPQKAAGVEANVT